MQTHSKGDSRGNAKIGVACAQIHGRLKKEYHEQEALQGRQVSAIGDVLQ